MYFKADGNAVPRRHGWLIQLLLVMNLTVVIITVLSLQVSATVYAQKTITLSKKGASLETVFSEIRKQTGYTFFCRYEWLQEAKKVDVEVKNATLEQVLDLCFKDQ